MLWLFATLVKAASTRNDTVSTVSAAAGRTSPTHDFEYTFLGKSTKNNSGELIYPGLNKKSKIKPENKKNSLGSMHRLTLPPSSTPPLILIKEQKFGSGSVQGCQLAIYKLLSN